MPIRAWQGSTIAKTERGPTMASCMTQTIRLRPLQRLVWLTASTLLVAGAGIWLWKAVLEDRVVAKRWGVVEEGSIYRSGQLSASLVETVLKRYHIAVIVSLTSEDPNDRAQRAELHAAADLGIDLQRYILSGNGTGDIQVYARVIAAIVQAKKAGRPVLVHCATGSQRTGGVIAFYRLLVERWPASSVYRELRRYGWRPSDRALLEYVDRHMADLARLLVDMGVIQDVPDPLPALGRR